MLLSFVPGGTLFFFRGIDVFVKLFSDILQSSIWAENNETRLVWITMLTLADKDGFVHATAPGIAHLARIDIDATRKALDIFQEPDPDSRTTDNDGRRIERVPGGFAILNYKAYRDLRNKQDQREKTAARVRKHRADKKLDKRNAPVTPVTQSNDIAEAEAEADTDLKTILDSWNELAAFHGLPKASKLTDKRRRQIKARLKDKDWDWRTALARIPQCPFLMGENGRGWRADFDWFIKPDSVMKIMEGKYAGQQKPMLTRNARSSLTQPRTPDKKVHVLHV